MYAVGQGLIIGEGDNRISIFLAQQRLEQLRSLGFENALPTDSAGNTLTSGQIDENPVSTHSAYRRRTSIVCPREDDYSILCTASAGGTCPTSGPLCPTTYGTRLIVVTVEAVTGGITDRETRPITLRTVMVRR
jgi:hypothetical protein